MGAQLQDRPWGRPDPAVAETRVAVRRALKHLPGDGRPPLVLVALSGGADSLALAAAAAFEAPRAGLRVGAVVVDHGLQAGSAEAAERAAAQAAALGIAPVLVRRVHVAAGDPDGPEAAARAARYAALESAREELGAAAVLTAHTRDDQAEQVLLALARGSGTRAIAGIPQRRGAILRPLLGVSRQATERACAAQGLEPWNDPHNADPAYARVRVRLRILPLLEQELGPGIAASLARSAELAREDAEALDAMAAELIEGVCGVAGVAGAGGGAREPDGARCGIGETIEVSVEMLAAQPAAVRHRILRTIARDRFGAQLSRDHTLAVASLVTDWRGQGPIDAPGIEVSRAGGRLILRAR